MKTDRPTALWFAALIAIPSSFFLFICLGMVLGSSRHDTLLDRSHQETQMLSAVYVALWISTGVNVLLARQLGRMVPNRTKHGVLLLRMASASAVASLLLMTVVWWTRP